MTENTRDLAEFGFIELMEAGKLLTAYGEHGHQDFEHSGITVEFNPNSGNVFLVNDEYQVLMMNGGDLEQFYTCNECGNEGFTEDVKTEKGRCNKCHKKETFI